MTNTVTRRAGLIAAVLASVAVLAACGGSSGSDAEPASDHSAAGTGAPGDSGRKVAPTEPGATSTDSPGSTGTTAEQSRQKLTYTATVRIRVDDTTAKSTRAEGIVTRSGGYVQNQQQYGDRAATASATTTFRVPSAKYRTVLGQLGKLGRRTSLSQRSENVTEEVADVDARVRSANTSLTRLRTLLKSASDVKDLLAIESEISRREADLESMQARQRALDDQVGYATITLSLTGPVSHDAETGETGFLAGLRAGWHGLVGFLTGLLTVVGAVLPFTLVAAPLAFLGYVAWRRYRRPRAGADDDAATPAAPVG